MFNFYRYNFYSYGANISRSSLTVVVELGLINYFRCNIFIDINTFDIYQYCSIMLRLILYSFNKYPNT